MAKYNIIEKKEKVAAYRTLVSPKMMDDMQEKIMDIIVMQKKYRDKDYSAKKLAEELGVPFVETSAKSGVNIDNIFSDITERIDKEFGNILDATRYTKNSLTGLHSLIVMSTFN